MLWSMQRPVCVVYLLTTNTHNIRRPDSMISRLQPGRLAQLILALYTAREQRINGTLGPALLHAARSANLDVIYTTDQVSEQSNKYHITAALLAPAMLWESGTPQRHTPSSAGLGGCKGGPQQPQQISTLGSQEASLSMSRCNHRTAPETQGIPAHQQQSAVNESAVSLPSRQPPSMFPVYLIVAGVDRGLECHLRANMQILSQADFFWGLDWFWQWVGQQLGHYQTVPDVLLRPQSEFMVPWVRSFHEQYMSQLRQQGYTGLQVIMSGHSLGAAIVDTAALMMPHSCNNLPLSFTSISFESPGVPQAVLQQYGHNTAAEVTSSTMISYLGNPSPVSSLCEHPGQMYHLYAEPLAAGVKDAALYVALDAARVCVVAHVLTTALGVSAEIMPTNIALAAAVTAAVTDKVWLAWKDLVLHHSLAGMNLAFDKITGQPEQQAVQQMASWPLFSPALGSKFPRYLLDLMLAACLPSVLYTRNRGVQMFIEGQRARHMRLLQKLSGYRPV